MADPQEHPENTRIETQPAKADFVGIVAKIKDGQEKLNKVRLLAPAPDPDRYRRFTEAVRTNANPNFNVKMLIPPRFRHATVGNFEDTAEIRGSAFAAVCGGNSAYLGGPPGIGKTHLGVGLMREWAALQAEEAFEWPQFLPTVELMQELKREMDRGVTGADSALDRWSKAPLLMLDDIGVGKGSEWATATIYTLIDRRYRDMKPVIVTSNYDLDEISSRLDDRIASRLSEMGVVLCWKDADRRAR